MKKTIAITMLFAVILCLPFNSFAQFKKDVGNPNISGILTAPATADALFGLIDPSKLHMRHSVSMSYGMMGSNGMMLSSYMNMMDYQISDNLLLRANLGIMTSPYNTMGEGFYLNEPRFFGGAALEYKFNEKSSISLQFQSTPYYYYRPMLGEYNNYPFH